LLLTALILLPSGVSVADGLLRERLAALRGHERPAIAGVELSSVSLIDDFYGAQGYRYLWRRGEQVKDLEALAERSREHGLRPADFNAGAIGTMLGDGGLSSLSGPSRVDAEILLSDSLLRIIHHLRYGKVDPKALDRSWNHDDGPDSSRLVRDLGRALAADDLEGEVLALWHPPDFYNRLKDGLARYRALAAAGGWAPVPEGRSLGVGMIDPRIPAIRERLRVTGDFTGGEPAAPRRYDDDLERAVKAFQERHTLGVDGIIGPATLAAMNVSAAERVGQIRANLERMRWVAGDLSGDYLLVDIAAQGVKLYRGGELIWASRAIVGRPDRQTPVFRDRIEYLQFNPTWTVPPTILREDVLPEARQDPGAVREKGLEVVDRAGNRVEPESVDWSLPHNNLPYQLRQPPGPKNALGQVKFMFPNRHSVYLHDTPNRSLFAKPRRAFSSGCVRVERPLELAELLLDDPKWSQSRFESVLGAERPATVRLREPVPVILSYWTAEADADGLVRFREDIYGRDAAVLAALDGTSPMRVVNGPGGVSAPENNAHRGGRSEPGAAPGPARSAKAARAPAPERERPLPVGYGTELPGEGPLFSF
jgi:murein L,D-transpeptidase YcbB/YkuD